MFHYFLVILAAFLGGIVQSTTGFGSGIIMLLFFPVFLPLIQSAALSNMISICLLAFMAWKYRKYTQWKYTWFPMAAYMSVSCTILYLLPGIDLSALKLYFGFFLMALGLYFMFFSEKARLKPNFPTAFICSTLSGAASGFFGIGGPLMAVYFLSVLGDDKEGYIGTTQMFFFITSFINNLVRIANGIVTLDLVPFILAGLVGMTFGSMIGGKILKRVNVRLFKKLIYGYLILSGGITVVQCLL